MNDQRMCLPRPSKLIREGAGEGRTQMKNVTGPHPLGAKQQKKEFLGDFLIFFGILSIIF
jgi:hypothetical protein